MNEQNNNINPTPQPLNNNQPPRVDQQNMGTPIPPNVPQQGQAPVAPQPVQSEPITPVTPIAPVSPIQPVAPTTPTEPVTPTAPTAPVPPTQPVTPTPNMVQNPQQPINQGIQTIQPSIAPQETPVQNIQVPTEPPIQTPITPVNPSPEAIPMNQGIQSMNANTNAEPQSITQEQPMNQVVNNQFNPSTPTNGVFAPSVPIGGASDVTNVGFVAASSEIPKKKKPLLTIGIIVVILAIIGAIGYFVVYPYIVKNYFSNPKNVYETTIKTAFKGLNTTVNDIVHNKGIYNLEVSVDSNIESLAEYVGYTYGLNMGIDPTKKTLQQGIYVKDNKTKAEHSYYSYLKDNKYYDKYSSYRDYIYLGEAKPTDSLISLFNQEDLFNTSSNLNSEDVNYVINKISDLLVESIKEDRLTKEDASININGETLKVTSNKYTLNYEIIKETIEYVRDGFINDDKAIEILAKISNVEKDEIKKQIEAIKVPEKKEEKDFEVTTSIYTYGTKNEIVGFALNDSEEKLDFYYYFKDNIVDSKITYTYKDAYNKNGMVVVKLSSTSDKNTSNVKIAYDNKDFDDINKGKELLSLNIRKWDETGIDLDYNVTIENKYKGTIRFDNDITKDRAKYTFDFSVKNGNEYMEVKVAFQDDWTSEIANINTSAAVTLTDEEIKTHRNEFIKTLKDTPLGKLLTTVSNDYDPSIKDYYDQNNLNNPSNFINDNQDLENQPNELQ